jgi:hypothetical protein
VITVSNLNLAVSTAMYNATTDGLYRSLPPIAIQTDQPNITVMFAMLSPHQVLHVKEPVPSNASVQYGAQNITLTLSGETPTIRYMLDNSYVQYTPTSSSNTTDVCILMIPHIGHYNVTMESPIESP